MTQQTNMTFGQILAAEHMIEKINPKINDTLSYSLYIIRELSLLNDYKKYNISDNEVWDIAKKILKNWADSYNSLSDMIRYVKKRLAENGTDKTLSNSLRLALNYLRFVAREMMAERAEIWRTIGRVNKSKRAEITEEQPKPKEVKMKFEDYEKLYNLALRNSMFIDTFKVTYL